jgi:hypothetical protein
MIADSYDEERPTPPLIEGLPDMAAIRSKATDLEEQARALVRDRPVVAVLAAVGVGYIVARLFTRGGR